MTLATELMSVARTGVRGLVNASAPNFVELGAEALAIPVIDAAYKGYGLPQVVAAAIELGSDAAQPLPSEEQVLDTVNMGIEAVRNQLPTMAAVEASIDTVTGTANSARRQANSAVATVANRAGPYAARVAQSVRNRMPIFPAVPTHQPQHRSDVEENPASSEDLTLSTNERDRDSNEPIME